MTLPDVLAMSTSGQPAPGKRVRLPSGAVWEGGAESGTSTLTLPDEAPATLDSDGRASANTVLGAGLVGVIEDLLDGVLGADPTAITEQIAAQTMDLLRPEMDSEPTTRLVKFSSRTTLLNPSKTGTSDIADTVVGYSRGGPVSGPGGPRTDSVLAAVSDGEYIVNAAATANALPWLEAINAGWVPSVDHLRSMVPGFANGGMVGGTPIGNSEQWRDLLGTGMVADVLGGIAGAAVDAAGTVGSALGGALAPVLGGARGLFARRTQDPVKVDLGASGVQFGGADDSTAAELNINPDGVLAAVPGLATEATPSTSPSVNPLASLTAALSSGVVSAATEAGGRVGAALGAAIAPALGPAGQLAPEIGEQLGQTIGSRFGGGFEAAMTLKTEMHPAEMSTGGSGGGPGSATDGGSDLGAESTMTPTGFADETSGGTTGLISYPSGTSSSGSSIKYGTDWGEKAYPEQQKSLAQTGVTYADGDTIERGAIVGSSLTAKLAEQMGLGSSPLLSQLGAGLGSLVGAYGGPDVLAALGLDSPLADEAGVDKENPYFFDFTKPEPYKYNSTQNGVAGVEGLLSGLASGGLVKGVTGAMESMASDTGSQFGSWLGSSLGTMIGGAAGGPIGAAIGSVAGSIVASTAANLVTKPVEWAASTAKELVGTGFGLTDLAEGPGAHTLRGDIFNFNGMDPKSVAKSIARVQRRQSFAAQRGGGFDR
ncbi:hypothetical protein [Nocardia lijiangensis]|uniref:hypothetical protein n=1 Tax=Nocardia lijiangensis TaxID=299618 RepID=UPI003D7057AC